MAHKLHGEKPIYLQLVDRINRQIYRGELQLGQKLNSVRDMAIQLGVNPNTMARTYSELESMFVVEAKRGQGTFVTDNEELILQHKQEMKDEYIQRYMHDMEEMGYTPNEMVLSLLEHINRQQQKKS